MVFSIERTQSSFNFQENGLRLVENTWANDQGDHSVLPSNLQQTLKEYTWNGSRSFTKYWVSKPKNLC